MKEESYWKKFWVSGQVKDYLNYTSENEHLPSNEGYSGKTVKKAGGPKEEGYYAGIDICNRYGTESDTCR